MSFSMFCVVANAVLVAEVVAFVAGVGAGGGALVIGAGAGFGFGAVVLVGGLAGAGEGAGAGGVSESPPEGVTVVATDVTQTGCPLPFAERSVTVIGRPPRIAVDGKSAW